MPAVHYICEWRKFLATITRKWSQFFNPRKTNTYFVFQCNFVCFNLKRDQNLFQSFKGKLNIENESQIFDAVNEFIFDRPFVASRAEWFQKLFQYLIFADFLPTFRLGWQEDICLYLFTFFIIFKPILAISFNVAQTYTYRTPSLIIHRFLLLTSFGYRWPCGECNQSMNIW